MLPVAKKKKYMVHSYLYKMYHNGGADTLPKSIHDYDPVYNISNQINLQH